MAIPADPNDPEDFDVSVAALEQGLAEREERRRLRGAQKAPIKELVSIRLDADVVEALRASGTGWQGRVNSILRKKLLDAA
ncbi:MAG: BrnA antitoxin family protein [Sphingobium sp.]|uniref:BrnA antitoxin family protein n=1 Tax=Sphingobium sp. TaxID=1912891 RepID=UPI0029AF71A8|nr:BrnA antitoxin family protein [Sphingobium sp.]MDX3908885.1 BrnA antitoxin family protein [Sphingobium sp.]